MYIGAGGGGPAGMRIGSPPRETSGGTGFHRNDTPPPGRLPGPRLYRQRIGCGCGCGCPSINRRGCGCPSVYGTGPRGYGQMLPGRYLEPGE